MMVSKQQSFSWPIRVYIEDTDSGGIVYHANYLYFMERARTEYLRHLGFGKAFIFNAECLFVVKTMHIDYYQPAKLDDALHITATIVTLSGASMILKQSVLRADHVMCEADVTLVCVQPQTMRPKRIPTAIATVLKSNQ